ncbi:mogroside IE synthase-like [Aristolochia californica]|uniref:mogroside IE synthase-like n=1 Tax=Aristolochia californica TaxID=171875 RepID=UPI0035DCBF36
MQKRLQNRQMGEIGDKGSGKAAHVLVFPYPSQGHINPMLQFAKRLFHKGVEVSLVTTIFLNKSMVAQTGPISLELISDGNDYGDEKAGSIEAYLQRFKKIGSRSLTDLIQKLSNSGRPVDCLVYDSFLPWALDVAKQFEVPGASFFTQSCAVEAIYYNVYTGRLAVPVPVQTVSLPGLPELQESELPSFISKPDYQPGILEFVMEQFINIEKADWVFCNTVDHLEDKEVSWWNTIMPVKAIGPTIPSWYVDKRMKEDQDYGVSLWKKDSAICKEWLDSKDDGSVIYLSFGSVANLGPTKMEEITCALRESDHYFLWVVRESEESNLPENFAEETKVKGLVVRWCPQLEVLSHRAVGCFVTHCGWNSTLEGLTLGVPMVACPQWSDQPTNAKYIEEVWGVGIRARVDDKGIISREELKNCLKEIMEGERGEVIKRKACKWGKLVAESLEEGGSSDKNIEEFVAAVCR